MNIAKDLSDVAASLRCPEVKAPQTIKTICYLISKFNKLETSDAYSILLARLPEFIEAWKEGKGHNLSSVIWKRGRWALLAECKRIKVLAAKEEGTFSLDAHSEGSGSNEDANLHETIQGKSETIDWKDAFDYLFGNAGFTEREKLVFLGLKDGKTLEAIGLEFGVSRAAIHLSKVAIVNKSNRIKSRVYGRELV
jgi:hypothetical protein